MTIQEAKKIGSNQALKSVVIGIVIAYLIMSLLSSDSGFLKALLWFTTINYKLNLLIGVIIMLVCGYYLGQRAGYEILIKRINCYWVGIKYGILVLVTTTFFSSWVGFFQEGVHLIGTNDNPFNDYILRPVMIVFEFGFIPVLIVGSWFGKQIKKQEAK